VSDDATFLPVVRAAKLADATETRSWLVASLWARAAVGILGSAPKCCKSWLALELAVAVATKTRCLDRFAVEDPGSVMLYMAEDSAPVIKSRLQGLCEHRGVRFESAPIDVITAPSVRIDRERDQDRLTRTVRRGAPRLLVLDPFVRLHRVDENDAGQVSAVLGYLRALQRSLDVAVLVVHHARKNGGAGGQAGQSLRGSGDLHAWGDSNLYLRRHQGALSLTIEHRAAPHPTPSPSGSFPPTAATHTSPSSTPAKSARSQQPRSSRRLSPRSRPPASPSGEPPSATRYASATSASERPSRASPPPAPSCAPATGGPFPFPPLRRCRNGTHSSTTGGRGLRNRGDPPGRSPRPRPRAVERRPCTPHVFLRRGARPGRGFDRAGRGGPAQRGGKAPSGGARLPGAKPRRWWRSQLATFHDGNARQPLAQIAGRYTLTALARLALFCLRHAREPQELVDALGRWLDLVREVHSAPGGREALARIWRYIFVVSNPAEPEDLVKRLVGVVGKESEEEVMSVADWLELKGVRDALMTLLRTRFGEVPDDAVARVEAADKAQLKTWLVRVLTAPTLDDVLAQA